MTHTAGDRFVVVLKETQDLVNIAGTARAMLNMGFHRLRLVRPAEYDAYRIEGIAHGSGPLVERVEFFDSLQGAVADAAHVAGTTARRRTAAFVWQHPRDAATELVALAARAEGPIALVFGREDQGLANEDLDLCDRLLTIPTDPAHSSLNLAQAVLLVTYELAAALAAKRPLPRPRKTAPPAEVEDLQRLFAQTETTLQEIDFFKTRNPPAVMRTLRALARRASLNTREAGLLTALAIEVRKYVARARDVSD